MAANELLEWFDILSESDHFAFKEYLQSHDKKARKLAIRLHEWLSAHPSKWRNLKSNSAKQRLQDELHQLLFFEKAFKAQRIRRVFMELKELLEDFLALRAEPKLFKKLDHEIRIMKYLQEQGASRLFLRRLAAFETYLEKEAPLSPDTYLAKMWIEQMRTEYFIHQNIPDDTFEIANIATTKFFLLRMLENFTSMRARERHNPKQHTYLYEAEVLRMLESNQIDQEGLLNLWKSAYLLASPAATAQIYQNTLMTLESVKHRLPLITLRQVRGHMLNYLVRSQELGSQTYYRRLWELWCEMLSEGTLHMPDGRMTFQFFISTVRSACLCGEHRWAAQFIAQYQHDLVSEGRTDQVDYCNYLTQYYAGNLQEVWHGMLTFRPKDIHLESYTRTLQVQVAYDLGKEDEFLRNAESLRKFIDRNKELGSRFTTLMQEFTRFAERLGYARFVSQKLPKGLPERLKANDTAEKLWLLEKVRELGKQC